MIIDFGRSLPMMGDATTIGPPTRPATIGRARLGVSTALAGELAPA